MLFWSEKQYNIIPATFYFPVLKNIESSFDDISPSCIILSDKRDAGLLYLQMQNKLPITDLAE